MKKKMKEEEKKGKMIENNEEEFPEIGVEIKKVDHKTENMLKYEKEKELNKKRAENLARLQTPINIENKSDSLIERADEKPIVFHDKPKFMTNKAVDNSKLISNEKIQVKIY